MVRARCASDALRRCRIVNIAQHRFEAMTDLLKQAESRSSMSRRYVAELTQQEEVDQVFLVSEKQLRPNRNGVLYLQFELSDRTGSISARMWNADEALYRSFDNGDFVQVEGTTQLFQGAMQLIVKQINRVDPNSVNRDDFSPVNAVAVDALQQRLSEVLRSMNDPHLRTLAECFLMDSALMEKLANAPAGVKHHHAYRGGLLEHTVAMMELAARVAPLYPQLDRDLLMMGAFLHDLGKVDELSYDRDFGYTDQGQLIGHLVIAVEILNRKLAEAERLGGEPIPEETVLRLKHMLLSHHGEYEFGSPKLPMTVEAMALYCIDFLDAKLNAFCGLLRDDPNKDSTWTYFHPQHNRKLFKGKPKTP